MVIVYNVLRQLKICLRINAPCEVVFSSSTFPWLLHTLHAWSLDSSDTCDSVIVTTIRLLNYCHHLLHHLHVRYLSIMFDIFIIALVLWVNDHAFILQKLLLYFERLLSLSVASFEWTVSEYHV